MRSSWLLDELKDVDLDSKDPWQDPGRTLAGPWQDPGASLLGVAGRGTRA
jgi:hypothetical protein